MENYNFTDHRKLKSTHDQMMMFLKMHGAQPAFVIAKEFGMTGEGARLHLLKMINEKVIKAEHLLKGVGRPMTLYSLTEKGHACFPDSHAELTTQILTSIKALLGEEALNRIILDREKTTFARYIEDLKNLNDMEDKLTCLAEIRVREGYMAEWQKDHSNYLFIENHCPICAAAAKCPEFCHSELKNFRQVLGKDVQVERNDHIIKGARRCVYTITRKMVIHPDLSL
ncbi:MAG: helix-turn-helix transcriptional regulator [Mangrovibacterium sp.]